MKDSFLPELKEELENDPQGVGYWGKEAGEVTELMNTVGLTNQKVSVGLIDAYKITNAVEAADFHGLSATDMNKLTFIVSAGIVDVSNQNIQHCFKVLFGPSTTTRANLIALSTRDATRAEFLGFGKMEPWFVIRARRL